MLNKSEITPVRILCAAAFLLMSSSAAALDNPFRAYANAPVEVSVAAERQKDDVWQVALHLDLAEGWKTYWHAPGPFGIPPRIELDQASNVAAHALLLPEPLLVRSPTGDFAGYEKDVSFLLQLQPSDPSLPLKASVILDFAVCSDVCVPERRQISLALVPGMNRNVHRIALLERQIPRAGSFVKSVDWKEGQLAVTLSQPALAVLAESLDDGFSLSLPLSEGEGQVSFKLTRGQPQPGARVRLTLLNGLGGLVEEVELPAR